MTEVEAPPPSADPGRWIRAALVILPVGTILLGIASFGIWQWKKDRAEDRSFRYAMALRQQISENEIQRHMAIVREALAKPNWQLSIPAYLESTMGAENMGYTVRRTRFGNDYSLVDAELTGKNRPREVVMALVVYDNDPLRFERTAQAMAEALTVAHETTGATVTRCLRFAMIPNTHEALEKLKAGLNQDGERLMQLAVLGGPGPDVMLRLREILEVKKTGTNVIERRANLTVGEAVQSARELKAWLLDAAESL